MKVLSHGKDLRFSQNVYVTIVPIMEGKKRLTIAGYREQNREKVICEDEGIFHDTYCRFLKKYNKCALVIMYIRGVVNQRKMIISKAVIIRL